MRTLYNLLFVALLSLSLTSCEEDITTVDIPLGDITQVRQNEDFNAIVRAQPIEPVDSMQYSIDPQVLRTETVTDENLVCPVDIMAASASDEIFLFNHLDDMCVGCLYRYNSLFSGGFQPVLGGRLAGQRVGVAGLPVNTVSYNFPEPGIIPYLETINDLRQQTTYTAADAQIDFRVIDVYSMEQLSMQLGATLKLGLWGKISASIETNRLDEVSYFVIEMKQKHFSLNLGLPSTPSDFFAELPPTDELGSWSPVICSSVTYGRAAYFIVSSSHSRDTARLAIDATFKAFSSRLDVSVERQHEQVANEFRIDGLVYGGDQELALQTINGIEAIRDYISSGFQDDNAFGVPLAFKFRFLRDFSVAKTVSSVEYPVRGECNMIPEERTITISRDAPELTEIGRQTPIHVAGDRNFGGDGPNVWADLDLCLSEDRKRLELKIHVVFEETDAGTGNSDNDTRGEVNLRKVIYTAPSGFSIDEILTDRSHHYHYVDDDHSVDISPAFLNELAYQHRIMGDTNNSDIPSNSNSNGADGYSYWSADFNDIRLRIKQN